MRFFKVLCVFFASLPVLLTSQAPKKYTSTEIHHEIQKLNFLGTALFLAAHPDDENTRLIAYLANELKARTAYLSLTRGDGGQNLIGPELRESLGLLRTQELLAARRVDGGEQWFSRANDFGFSKHPDETLRIWDKEKVLADIVWTIRQLKPDIIVNRFDHRSPGTTHGHHTTSAMLGFEAFDLVNNPNSYPEQLNQTDIWQPKRLYFNTSWWFYGGREKFEKADKSNMAMVDVGAYYPELGLSNNEIASMASSQHKCQGFGRLLVRGAQPEYLELLKGEKTQNPSNLFEGIETSRSRIKGGEPIGELLYEIEKNFNFNNPSTHLPKLVEAYALLQQINDKHWKFQKSEHLKKIILACGGIYLEGSTKTSSAIPGEKVTLFIEALNRTASDIQLKSVTIEGIGSIFDEKTSLPQNEKKNMELTFMIPKDKVFSNPYWLNEKGSLGMYKVNNTALVGKPETPAAFNMNFILDFDGTEIAFKKSVIHRYSKPDFGEIYEPFVVLPKVTANFSEDVFLFNTAEPQNINMAIRAGTDNISGIAKLSLPKNWTSRPSSIDFNIDQKGAIQNVVFQIFPPENESVATISPLLIIEGKTFDRKLVEIEYDHIPKQSILLPAEAKVVRTNIKKEGERIGYIVGAGDKVPESLSQIGYQVDLLNLDDIEPNNLGSYDGIVLGIRAYNVLEDLKFKQNMLLDYVKNGGNMIVQYNTAGRWRAQFKNIAPYPITLTRDRVTDENAPVTILAKNHPLVSYPNQITEKDFDGWVQERGLYFPREWDSNFTPILSMADKGEEPKQGSLLVASYGKGNYIYTGLSFFRELPAGVPGAYKLFANMLSMKKQTQIGGNGAKE
ncbi:MAG: PIG-L family deacetylase [Croceivirga sp.]